MDFLDLSPTLCPWGTFFFKGLVAFFRYTGFGVMALDLGFSLLVPEGD